MANVEDSFTQRILRRASLRRQRDSSSSLNSSREARQRREKILRAINEPSSRRSSSIGINDSQQFDRSCDFSRDSFNMTGLSFNNDNNNDENSINAYKSIDDAKLFKLKNTKNPEAKKNDPEERKNNSVSSAIQETPKPTQDRVESPSQIVAKIKNLQYKNTSAMIDFIESMKTPIFPVYDDSEDEETDHPCPPMKHTFTTQAVIEMCNRVYEALDLNRDSSSPQCLGIHEPRSNSLDSRSNDSDPEDFSKTQTEAATLESTNRLSPRKILFPAVEDPEEHHVSTLKSPTEDPEEVATIPSSAVTLESTEEITSSGSDDPEEVPEEAPSRDSWFREPEDVQSQLNLTFPYDEAQFLADALGDELNRLSVTFDDLSARDRTQSDFTASDLMSEESFPLQSRVMRALNLPTSEPSSPRSSSTLNRSLRLYRSLSQRIKKKFRPVLKTGRKQGQGQGQPKKEATPSTKSSASKEIDMIQDLLQEVKTQQTLMNEAARALRGSDNRKTHLSNAERIDSERSLLLAGLRRTAALEEIKGITANDDDLKDTSAFRERAEVTISDISVDLRDPRSLCGDSSATDCYVVAVAQGLNVWLTPAVRCVEDSTTLRFAEAIAIPDLTPGFRISVKVYAMRSKVEEVRSEDRKMEKHQRRSTSCLPYSSILASPTKLFRKVDGVTAGSELLRDHEAWKSRNSAFVLCAFAELRIEDLSTSCFRTLTLTPDNVRLNGSFDVNLACRLHLETRHEGFLNFYEEIGGFAAWNRRWCVLEGHTMRFWNYPREQDVKEPLKVIELVACVSNEIATVDRTICPRPRTLLIETERLRVPEDRDSVIHEVTLTSTYVRNLLSCDTTRELTEWSDKLNHVLLALEEWRIIGQRTQLQVSDL